MKILVREKRGKESYILDDGSTIEREFNTKTPNGNKMNGRWVLRDKSNNIMDFDVYINDLADRNNINLYRQIK